MANKIIQNFNGDKFGYLTIEQAKKRVAELASFINNDRAYYHRRHVDLIILTIEEREEILLEEEYQTEIDFYEFEIFNAEAKGKEDKDKDKDKDKDN